MSGKQASGCGLEYGPGPHLRDLGYVLPGSVLRERFTRGLGSSDSARANAAEPDRQQYWLQRRGPGIRFHMAGSASRQGTDNGQQSSSQTPPRCVALSLVWYG